MTKPRNNTTHSKNGLNESQTGTMKEISTSTPMTEKQHRVVQDRRIKARRENEDRRIEQEERRKR